MMKKLWPHVVVAVVSTLLTLAVVRLVDEGKMEHRSEPAFRLVHQRTAVDVEPSWELAEEEGITSEQEEDLGVAVTDQASATHKRNISLPDFRVVSKKVTPAVVNITITDQNNFRIASGSGVSISEDGYIITNRHVIEEAKEIEVTFPNKKQYQASLVGEDPTTDLALLKIKAGNLLPAIRFGDSDRIDVGEWVLAVGNPFNLMSTVTAGIVSAKGRNIDILEGAYAIESFIQTDAVVNPGNSGGALLNVDGELIGINTAIITESGGYEGYSFAIPSNLVRKIVFDLREYGKVQRAVLGVEVRDVDNHTARETGLTSSDGVLITRVTAGGTAAAAGLENGDIILSINGRRISTVPQLQEQIGRYRPGDVISIGYMRSGKYMQENRVELYALEGISRPQ